MLWPPPDLRPLRYYYCDVSGSNWLNLSQSSWPELVCSTCTEHKGLELFSSSESRRTGPYPILEPSAELYPARISLCFEEEKKISLPAANSLSSELSERVDPPIPFVLATYPDGLLAKSSPATTEEATRLLWRGGFFLSQ